MDQDTEDANEASRGLRLQSIANKEQTTSLNDLPTEILIEIIENADYVTRVALSLTNKRLYATSNACISEPAHHDHILDNSDCHYYYGRHGGTLVKYCMMDLLEIERWPMHDSVNNVKKVSGISAAGRHQDLFACHICLKLKDMGMFSRESTFVVCGNAQEDPVYPVVLLGTCISEAKSFHTEDSRLELAESAESVWVFGSLVPGQNLYCKMVSTPVFVRLLEIKTMRHCMG